MFQINKMRMIRKMILLLILSILIILFFIFLPIIVDKVKSDSGTGSDVIVDLQVGNNIAVLNLPSRLTEFKENREVVQIKLLEAPFITKGVAMLAIRDLEKLFPGNIEWNSATRTIRVWIPGEIVSKGELLFTLTDEDEDFIIKNGRAFSSVRLLSKLLGVSEIIWSPETQGIRLIWYGVFAP